MMRETCIRSSILALFILSLLAAPSFAQSAGDREQTSPPAGRYRGESLQIAPLAIYFSGNYSYSYTVGSTCTLKADSVSNTNGSATGPLRFSLWFTTAAYPSSGYVGASYQFSSSLAAGASVTNVQGTVPFTNPPTGCYNVTFVLEELVASTWTARDYGGFTKSADSGNGCIASFSASPATIASGGSSTLAWTTLGTVNGVIIDNGVGSQPANSSASVSPAATTTYTLSANNTATTPAPSKSATVTVSAPAPTATFSASPTSIVSGSSSTLAWTTTNATSVSIDNGIGAVALSGTRSVAPSATTTYTLTVSGSGGTITRNATVTVTPPSAALRVTASGFPTSGTAPFTTSFTANATGGTPPYTYKWSTGESGPAMSHQWSHNGTFSVNVVVTDATAATATSNAITITANLPAPTGPCSDPQYVCLNGSRFAVKIEWKTTDGKSSGVATPIKYTADSGLFWFFGPDNIEVLLKVLNACGLNSRYWIFSAATTDVEYTITVLDTVSGNKKTYFHAGGTPAPAITDTDGLPCTGGLTSAEPDVPGAMSTLAVFDGPTLPNATNLCADPNYVCLANNRFAVKIDWKTTDGKSSGTSTPIKYTPDSGLFWFFGPDNIEVLLKVLNGCALNNRFWVFAAATTDVEYTIVVTDTQTGKSKTYFHAGGTPAPAITDTDAMSCGQ
jgi:PKD repeat protein